VFSYWKFRHAERSYRQTLHQQDCWSYGSMEKEQYANIHLSINPFIQSVQKKQGEDRSSPCAFISHHEQPAEAGGNGVTSTATSS
jgi:hypothetical protein